MEKKKSVHTDEGLQGNERIEEAILALQQEPTEELLAHALTVLRKRMQEKGQFIVAVEPPDYPDKGWWTLVDGIYRF